MKPGKLPESHLKRAVLKTVYGINPVRDTGRQLLPDVGMDGASLALDGGTDRLMVAQGIVDLPVKRPVFLAVTKALNNLYAAGGRVSGITLSIIVPADYKESGVKALMEEVKDCKAGVTIPSVLILGGDIRISHSVSCPVIAVNAIGTPAHEEGQETLYKLQPDMDIVMTKWTGMEATWLLAENRHDALHTRFSAAYIDIGKQFGDYLSVAAEASALQDMGVRAVHDVSGGGVFAALWELLEPSGLGCHVDLKNIPIKQETIEFAEYFHVNPYMLAGSGSLLAVTEDGEKAVQALEAAGIFATVIGKTTREKARAVCLEPENAFVEEAAVNPRRRHEREQRFLVPPKSDEIYQILSSKA